MSITSEIQESLKANKAIIGYRKSIKNIKIGNVKTVIIASNIDDSMKKEIEHNTKISGTELKVFSGTSKELGVVCGKPFPISAIVIRG